MRSVWAPILAVVATSVLAPGVASAGRTQYGWLYGTEVMPERGVELQTWIDEENGREPDDIRWTIWGFTALVGITDKLELSLPLEMLWSDTSSKPSGFTFYQYGIEARYRFVDRDAAVPPPIAPLVRVAVKRDVTTRDAVVVEADLVASTTTPSGKVHALVDVGYAGVITPDVQHHEVRPGAGVSVNVVGDLRLGVEAYAELSLDDQKQSWAVVGPNLAWSHGRFWLSAAFGIGVYQIDTAPRVQWGIMF